MARTKQTVRLVRDANIEGATNVDRIIEASQGHEVRVLLRLRIGHLKKI